MCFAETCIGGNIGSTIYKLTSQYSLPMPRDAAQTREKIVKTASRLFYGKGVRAVSMDTVAEKAGLTKKTLYYHFRSKDDLVTAYLASRDQPNLDLFVKWFCASGGSASRAHPRHLRQHRQGCSKPPLEGLRFPAHGGRTGRDTGSPGGEAGLGPQEAA